MARSNPALDVVEAVSVALGRLLPVIDHIPDNFGKWVPPIKKAVAENQKLVAMLGTAGAASKALRGRFNLVDSVMTTLNMRTLGASKKMSVLGSVGLMALSKVRRGMLDARKEAQKLAEQTGKAGDRMQKLKPAGGGGGSGFGGAKQLLAAVGAYRLAGAAIEGFKGAFDLGGKLNDMSQSTGIAADQLMVLNQAAKDSGIDDISGAVGKMQVALIDSVGKGTGPAAESLARLGLNARDLVKQSPVEQIRAIGSALQSIKNPALRTDTVRGIFGKSGADLMPLFENGSEAMDVAATSLGRQVTLMKDNVERFDKVSDRLGRSGTKMQGFFVGLASVVLPLMDRITERMDQADFATAGEQFGEKLKTATDYFVGAFKDPLALVSAIGDGLTYVLLKAANGFKDAMIMAIEAIGPKLLRTVGKALAYMPGGYDASKSLFDRAKGIEANAGASLGKDHFGAEQFKKWMEGSLEKLRTVGEQAVAEFVREPMRTPAVRPGRFDDFVTASKAGNLRTGSLSGASMAGTLIGSSASGASPFDYSRVTNLGASGVRRGPILSHAERRAFEDVAVTNGGTRAGSSAGAFGVIHAGDAARRKNAARERERERLKNENSVARSNELLTKIVDSTGKTAEALQ